MRAQTATQVLGYGGALLLVAGTVAVVAMMVLDPLSAVRRMWARYVAALEHEIRFLLTPRSGASIARLQLLGVMLIPVLAFVLDDWFVLLLIPPSLVAPLLSLRQRSAARKQHIEAQLDHWLLMLSNALKASPSLGEAITNSAKVVRPPMAQELDLALKEMKLGTPLHQAVLNMSTRIGSASVSSALATLLVGRQTGGDLSKILEESAATLREMARLEGVVRTKTAEGKSQAYVLGSVPFVLIGAIYLVDEHWLDPLAETTLGFTLMGAAAILWLAAILLARRILAVDV